MGSRGKLGVEGRCTPTERVIEFVDNNDQIMINKTIKGIRRETSHFRIGCEPLDMEKTISGRTSRWSLIISKVWKK